MATIERFEDLLCWQRARELTKEIYKNFKDLKDFGFRDQIQRAAVSVVSNISEGFESGTREEFINYLYIAKASAGEVRAQLYVALDAGYINISTFTHLKGLAEECSKLVYGFAVKVKGGARRGLQHKHVEKPDWLEEHLRENNMVRMPDGRIVSKDRLPDV